MIVQTPGRQQRVPERESAKVASPGTGMPKRNDFIVIESVRPQIDCGKYPVKRIIGDTFVVSADIVKSGHDKIYGAIKYKLSGASKWSLTPMTYSFDSDSWSGSFSLDSVGTYEYFVVAWTDRFSTLLSAIEKWADAHEDTSPDIEEIRKILESSREGLDAKDDTTVSEALKAINSSTRTVDLIKELEDKRLTDILNRAEGQDRSTSNIMSVIVDPLKAQFSTWYEMFHRSQGSVAGKSATFADCVNRLDEIRQMGFDVVYLPPIHPIGKTNRRGPNNVAKSVAADPGSPWAIGNIEGGHDAVNSELGTLNDFMTFVAAARKRNMEIALDLAFQCSPDHPYVKEHPEWFRHRKDGTIRYAENPPKRYYDIYPLDFETEEWQDLWEELARVVFFWIQNGVRIFRVDNPHTKPAGFWEWLIRKVKSAHAEVIFLSEAFTQPKSMKLLAKLGFTQSYTYFAWKNTKYELIDFLNEFVLSDVSEYYRGNFFTNTPDILHEYLQQGGRPAFKIRLVLAATLSSAYGIYNAFELCENRAKAPGSEEYADSEKYQYKVWDWNRPGNIKEYIEKINRIRRENPALQETRNLHLFRSDSEHILFYGKWNRDRSNVIFVAVNLDPKSVHESTVYVPLAELGINPQVPYTVRDLITGSEYHWHGESNYVKLDPNSEPAHIFRVEITESTIHRY